MSINQIYHELLSHFDKVFNKVFPERAAVTLPVNTDTAAATISNIAQFIDSKVATELLFPLLSCSVPYLPAYLNEKSNSKENLFQINVLDINQLNN